MALQGAVLRAFETQAENCDRLGSPFTAHLCRRLAVILDDSTALGRAVSGWPPDPVGSALALRLCGALHRTVRAGRAPPLAELYPPVADTGPALDAALQGTITQRGGDLVGLLESAPQTNEVARSAILLGGLLTIAAETGLPLALNEIGASAGLNLHPDCYAYELGRGRRRGPGDAPLTISCDWRGAPPPLDARLEIASRAGSDIAPIDAADAQAHDGLLAYIWPDQPDRLERTAAALTHATAHAVTLARAEAADWVESLLAEPPEPGIVRVLMHSIAWQYFPRATQGRIAAALADAGAAVTREAPLAWLRFEPDGIRDTAAIMLTLWRGDGAGGETRALGRGDYHGRFAEWTDP
ncbi:MAG: DUF2332 domain-containing protein [Alphaproteobacteria bacterium]